jgi:hypothetical protein
VTFGPLGDRFDALAPNGGGICFIRRGRQRSTARVSHSCDGARDLQWLIGEIRHLPVNIKTDEDSRTDSREDAALLVLDLAIAISLIVERARDATR